MKDFFRMADEAKLHSLKWCINSAHAVDSSVMIGIAAYTHVNSNVLFPTTVLDPALLKYSNDGVLSLLIENKAGHFVDFDFENLRIKGEFPLKETMQMVKFDIPVQSVINTAIRDTNEEAPMYVMVSSFIPYLPRQTSKYFPEHNTIN